LLFAYPIFGKAHALRVILEEHTPFKEVKMGIGIFAVITVGVILIPQYVNAGLLMARCTNLFGGERRRIAVAHTVVACAFFCASNIAVAFSAALLC